MVFGEYIITGQGMIYDFLPEPLERFVFENDVYELRLRADKQARANVKGVFVDVSAGGAPYITSKAEIIAIVRACAENSLYAQNENLKRGYIACKNGVRVGVAGECVCDGEKVLTIKNFGSVCIRFAREVVGCADKTYALTQTSGDKSILVISPPGVGKTTLIRDLARQISQKKRKNVLVIDDKGEICADGFCLGDCCDAIKYCDKNFGFYSAIKTLSPDFVIADELITEKDACGAAFASLSGVKTICTVHGESYQKIRKKTYLKPLFDCGAFDYFITLKKADEGFAICEFLNEKGEDVCIN